MYPCDYIRCISRDACESLCHEDVWRRHVSSSSTVCQKICVRKRVVQTGDNHDGIMMLRIVASYDARLATKTVL